MLIQKYENEVISLLGIRYAYKNINNISKIVQKVLGNLKDIFCAALLGIDEVEHM